MSLSVTSQGGIIRRCEKTNKNECERLNFRAARQFSSHTMYAILVNRLKSSGAVKLFATKRQQKRDEQQSTK